jgi:hypothetical protein
VSTVAGTTRASPTHRVSAATLWQRLQEWVAALWRRVRKAVAITTRVGYLLVLLGPPLAFGPSCYVISRVFHGKVSGALQQSWWDWLRWSVQHCGATFVKFGQWVSMRRDLFPPRLCDEFESLTDRAQPHPWAATERTLREELGDGYVRVFFLFACLLTCLRLRFHHQLPLSTTTTTTITTTTAIIIIITITFTATNTLPTNTTSTIDVCAGGAR